MTELVGCAPVTTDGVADSTGPFGQWYEELLNAVSIIAGFLVLASYPLVTADLSNPAPTHFTPEMVRTFAAVTVLLFIILILLCQDFKTIVRDETSTKNKTVTPKLHTSRRFLTASLLTLLIPELLFAALITFFLTIAAYVWIVGLVGVGFVGTLALWVLVMWLRRTWIAMRYHRFERPATRFGIAAEPSHTPWPVGPKVVRETPRRDEEAGPSARYSRD